MRYGLQQHLWRRRRGWGLSLWLQRFTPRRVQWQALGREVVQRRQWLLVVCFYCGGRPQLPGRHATGVHQGVPQHPAPGVPGVRRGVQDGVRSAGSEFLRSAGERQRLGEGQRMLEHHVHQSAKVGLVETESCWAFDFFRRPFLHPVSVSSRSSQSGRNDLFTSLLDRRVAQGALAGAIGARLVVGTLLLNPARNAFFVESVGAAQRPCPLANFHVLQTNRANSFATGNKMPASCPGAPCPTSTLHRSR